MSCACSIIVTLVLFTLSGCKPTVKDIKASPSDRYIALKPISEIRDGVHTEPIKTPKGKEWYTTKGEILNLRHMVSRSATIAKSKSVGEQWSIVIPFTEEGKRLWEDWTKANVAREVGIFVDGRLVFWAVIGSAITAQSLYINGNFTKDEAQKIQENLVHGTSQTSQ